MPISLQVPLQQSMNIGGAAVLPKTSKGPSMIQKRMEEAEKDPQLASVIADIKKNGPMAALKYAEDEGLMKKLEFIFGGSDAAMTHTAENHVMEMIGDPLGGLGPLNEIYGDVKPQWDRPRLLGGMQPAGGEAAGPKKKFGILSCLVCWCCFPCGLLACVYPLDDA
mmetsp:Transcript_127446/g.207581  ORF Transcript_127446/g.207581 Transcript_127446/m.207581 type:complete len:166 (+) Transcript_127446:79-576(+)